MAFAHTYDTATPAGGDDPREADDRMREIKAALQERLNKGIWFDLTGTEVTDTKTGYHRFRFNVKAYGALGDGIADDTVAIQAALTAGAGQEVYFPKPANQYVISAQLNVSAGTHLRGDGAESTTIFLKANSNVTMISIVQEDGVKISGLEINGNKTNQTTDKALIVIDQSNHCEVSYNKLLNAGLQAVVVAGGVTETTSYNHIHHNFIDTTDQQGIIVSALSADATHQVIGNTVEYNYITNTGYHGIEIKHPNCFDTVVHGNTTKSCAPGISANKGVKRVVISSNLVVDSIASGSLGAMNATEGGTGDTVFDIDFIGNIIIPDTSVDMPAIAIRTATRVNITDLIILADTGNTTGTVLILGTDDDEIMISGVIIESTGGIGIISDGSGTSNLTITDCYIGASTRGIVVNSRAIITNNTVHNADESGIYLEDADFSIVSLNISYNNEQSGVARAGIELHSSDNCLITTNQLFDNQGAPTQSYGVKTTNVSTNNTIRNNVFNGNVLGTALLVGSNKTDDTIGVISLPAGATPSVGGGSRFKTSGTTTITNLDDGYEGQIVTIIGQHSTTQLTDGGNLGLAGNMVLDVGDTIQLVSLDGTQWYELGRSNN